MNENDTRQEKTDNLKPAQRRAIIGLLSTQTVKAAATQAKVGEATLHRWLRTDAGFNQALRDAESEVIDTVTRQLIRLASEATATIESIMSDPAVPAGVRLRAADIILSRLLALRELANLETRVTALEAMLNESEKPD